MAGRGGAAGRGGGVALPGLASGGPGGGRGTGVALPGIAKAAPAPAPAPAPAAHTLPPPPEKRAPPPAPAGRGTGVALPGTAPAALSAPKPGVAAAAAPPPAAARAAVPSAVPSAGGSKTMPRKFKLPPTQGTMRVDNGINGDAKAVVKVKREFIPQWDKRKWSSQSLFYPYDKIKNDFELQGLFTRMKEKCWMCIYFDMILMYMPTKEGPPDMEDKLEGKPFAYFFIDNIVDSDKIQVDEAKLTIHLPTVSPKEDLKIICDTPVQLKEWSTTLKELAKMFETTPRDGIETREVVEQQLQQVQKDIPLQFEIPSENIDYLRASDWLLELRKLSELIRKHSPFIERIERFSQYRIGHFNVYCNFFQGRDRDGPSEVIMKAKKKVLGFWEAEVNRIIKLCEEVLSEPAIDKDHLPFHMEDCQIGVYYIDLINNYSVIVHNVVSSKVVLQKSAQQLEELYFKLQGAKTK